MEILDLLIVDDEPAALRYLASLIGKHCRGYRVSATAENGADALEKIRVRQPDLVITDIRMPLMDGLELANQVKAEFPGLGLLIASGYQDFEYARQALKHGVLDYLLKPVNGPQLAEQLAGLHAKLSGERYWRRCFLLRQLVSGTPADPAGLERFLPYGRFFIAGLRLGGLPSRFAPITGDPLADRCLATGRLMPANVWVVPGRDDQEILLAVAPELAAGDVWTATVRELAADQGGDSYTVLFDNAAHGLSGLREAAHRLYACLDRTVVFGQPRVRSGLPAEDADGRLDHLDPAITRQLEFLVGEGRFAELRSRLEQLTGAWVDQGPPQMALEAQLKWLVRRLLSAAGRDTDLAPGVPERLVEDALASSRDAVGLTAAFWAVIEDLARIPESAPGNADVPQFFAGIKTWLARNLEQALTLPGICEHFGISQSWLSKLFRRFEGMSFGDWLTTQRVEAAKRILTEIPDMPLKQVAARTGFRDQFYFSRVFKTITGQPPSEYGKGSDPKRPREG